MPESSPAESGPTESGISRRRVLTAAAVAAPAIALTTAVPAHATSINSTLTVNIDAASITAGDYATVTATVLDQYGNPWAGQPVQLSPGTTTGVTLSSTSGVTNSAGVFTTTLNTALTSPIGDTITITATSGPKTATATATVATAVITVTPAPTAIHNNTIHVRAGEANAITATLTTVSGRPLSATDVALSVSGFDATFGAYDSANPVWVTTVTGTTDGNGVYTAILTPDQALFGETAALTATGPATPDPRNVSAACTLTATNSNVYAAGTSSTYGLGEASSTASASLTRLPRVFPSRVTQISSGGQWQNTPGYFAYFLLDDGSIWASGFNRDGWLGVGDKQNRAAPTRVLVPASKDMKQVAATASGGIALSSDGEVYGWGPFSGYGNPVQVTGFGEAVTQIAGSIRSGYALTASGKVLSWGDNVYGQLGDGTISAGGNIPVYVTGLPADVPVSSITGHFYGAFAVLQNGDVYGWGWGNNRYILGSEYYTSDPIVSAVKLNMLSDISEVAAGVFTAYAVNRSGDLLSWGRNFTDYPQNYIPIPGLLGTGTSASGSDAVEISGLAGQVAHVYATARGAWVEKKDGTLVTWGYNGTGEFGNGSISTGSAVPIAGATSLPAGLTVIAVETFGFGSPGSLLVAQ